MAQVRVTPSGVMDKDTDVSYINQGNYTDANNIRHRQTDGGNFAGIMPIKGNLNKLTEVNGASSTSLPTYAAGDKKYRVTLNISDLISGELSNHAGKIYAYFEPPTGGLLPATVGYATGSYSSTTIATCVTDVQNVITNAISGSTGIPFSTFGLTFSATTVSGNYASFDISWSGYDITFKIDNTTGTYATFALIQEYTTVVGTGTFSVIGSQQLNDDIFLFLAGSHLNGEISVYSEIGVMYSTDNDATFKYKTLIRSKKLGFSPYKRIQCEVESIGNQINLYFTDGLNAPKGMYLSNSLKRTQNGLLKDGVAGAISGRYELQNIDTEAVLILPNPSSYFSSIEVIESAGFITAGNKRYTGRFSTIDFTYTDFLYPSNPVNIYQESFLKPYAITGNLPDVITDKAVKLTLTNIPQGVYSFFDLVAIEYQGESFTATTVQRFSIGENDTEIVVEHTNQGQENIQISNAELLAITQKFITAQTLKIFDNRMTLSNLVQQTDLNLNFWAQKIKHQINKKTIPFVGYLQDDRALNIQFSLDEYLNPNNVLNNTSYMYNDTYRFGIQVQWKSGKWSLPYWVDDIRIDTSNTNIIGNRRVAPTFTDASITNSFASGNDVNIFYVQFSNILLDEIEPTTNKPIRDLLIAFRFVRSERIPEVLATGLFFMGASYNTGNVFPYFNTLAPDVTTGIQTRHSFPSSVSDSSPYAAVANISNTDRSQYLFFYSPDYYFNKSGKNYVFNSVTDSLKILGVPSTAKMLIGNNSAGAIGNNDNRYVLYSNTYLELDGNIGTPTNNGFKNYKAVNHTFLDEGETKNLGGSNVSAAADYSSHGTASTYDFSKTCKSVNVFKLDPVLNPVASLNADTEWAAAGRNSKTTGCFYGQIFKDIGGNKKYPINKELSTYQSTGHIRNLIDGEAGIITESVFGGDVFNQKTYMLLRMGENLTYSISSGTYDGKGGLGFLLGMYSQNVFNTQMYYKTETSNTETGPGVSFPQYNLPPAQTITYNVGAPGEYLTHSLGKFTIGAAFVQFSSQTSSTSNNNTYVKSYDFKDGIMIENGFNALETFDGRKPASVAWSSKKITGSIKDNYRIFQPASFSDLDITNGEISVHEIINNNFYTFQERSVQRQYFRDPSAIPGGTGSDIVIGNGSIMGSRGQEITSIGTSKKWSLTKGKTLGGKETVYWFNDRLQKILRFGEDGSRVISDKGMLSYLMNNGKYNINTPEHLRGLGINGVWNDKYSEFIITFKYNDGVSNKAFTLVYDEIKNGFICFHTYFPNLYIPYNNNFFSVNPSASNQLFLHDLGSESTFYGTAQDANIEMVMNYEPNISKNFEALQIISEQKPFAANFTTKNHISFLVQNDFDLREDLYYSTIKNDSTGTGVNSNDTSRLWGRWLKIKVNLKSSSVGQKLINAIVKFRVMPRLFNQ
tara:strand:+ start:3339 stop:7589 length:4251 start_codon:yes stop_codon:yes gene_type:complete